MARDAMRRGAVSPSPLSSPAPSAVAAFAARKDGSFPFASASGPFRDVGASITASHASVSTQQAHATLSPRPRSPAPFRIDSADPLSGVATTVNSRPLSDNTDRRSSHGSQNSSLAAQSAREGAISSKRTSISDKLAERAFYRRILFQDLPAATEAPSITHDTDLDHEIYLLLAYLLRETVLPWYSKLTPDREFLTQITSIVTSIIHTIVERQTAGHTDAVDAGIHATTSGSDAELPRLHDLLSRDIPLVLRQHCSDFRQAQGKAESAWAPLGTSSSSSIPSLVASQSEQDERRRQQVYEELPPEHQQVLSSTTKPTSHTSPLQLAQQFMAASPHPGLDPRTGSLDGKIDPAYLRIAVVNLLSSLLPADEYAPDTEKFIVRDVLVTVLRGALARSFRPWFFVQSLHKALDAAGWASDLSLAFVPSVNDNPGSSAAATRQRSAVDSVVSLAIGLLTRLPALLLQAWTFLVLTAIPFLVRAYFDLFNVQRARKRRTQHQRGQSQLDDISSLKRSPSLRSTLPSSRSTGSLVERKMHGRYPSRKFQFSLEDLAQDQAHSSAINADSNYTPAEPPNGQMEDRPASDGQGAADEAGLAPDYVGNWLEAMEAMLQVDSRLLLRTLFGLARTILGTTGLGESVNRMTARRINAELKDTAKLARMVRELRGTLLPNGHLPPSVPDPDVETQEAEWIRLRLRLTCSTARDGQEPIALWLAKKVLLGSADDGLHRGGSGACMEEAQIQVGRLTTWLEPFCSPQAAGPNTLLAILLFERVVVAISPDLTLA